ncbi:hypothetical protein NE237_004047 [Protea cynaroides]|uniref:Alpha-carbonic anhydrase domain-containing protein n=1 Tax=Protea cynaroides TaxID=273540 RepID=A0A9Q0QT61_9MAGN|nr:hypothetical protein NE237_004047 [Protea cynaroides]
MAVRIALLFVGIALLLAAPLTQQHEVFSYGKETDKWGSLNPQFSECSTGTLQSPVAISKENVVYNPMLKPLTRHYTATNATLVNHGFGIGLQFENDGGVLIQDGKNYTLKQMLWHAPAEHTINDETYPLELQLIHVADDGSISVVAILYSYGDPDMLLRQLNSKIHQLAQEKCGGDEEAHISFSGLKTKYLKRNSLKYYRYVGSLTIPPCTTNVTWNILGKVREVSKEQIKDLKAPLDEGCKDNARPLQPLNGRKIELYDAKHEN